MTQGVKDQMLLGAFEQGLQERWKRELKPPPRTFEEALLLAQTAEASEKQSLRRNIKEQTEKALEATIGGTANEREEGALLRVQKGGTLHRIALSKKRQRSRRIVY